MEGLYLIPMFGCRGKEPVCSPSQKHTEFLKQRLGF